MTLKKARRRIEHNIQTAHTTIQTTLTNNTVKYNVDGQLYTWKLTETFSKGSKFNLDPRMIEYDLIFSELTL